MVTEPWWVHSMTLSFRTFFASEMMADMLSTTPVQKTGVCERALVRSVAACVEATVELCRSIAESLFASLARRGTLPTHYLAVSVTRSKYDSAAIYGNHPVRATKGMVSPRTAYDHKLYLDHPR